MEILACPHCDRQFHVTPAVLGKKIRCRGCRQIFHVPHDTSKVPLGPAAVASDEAPPPFAIAAVQEGRDVRSCPTCGRMFAMQPALAGKTIRCRGCDAPFRVTATGEGHVAAGGTRSPAKPPVHRNSVHQPQRPPANGPQPSPRPSAAAGVAQPRPKVCDDIGEVLEDWLPGEPIFSVVRPWNAAAPAQSGNDALVGVIAVVVGIVCALSITQLILWWIIQQDPLRIGPALPGSLEWVAPRQFRN